jgi:hypothetical protein
MFNFFFPKKTLTELTPTLFPRNPGFDLRTELDQFVDWKTFFINVSRKFWDKLRVPYPEKTLKHGFMNGESGFALLSKCRLSGSFCCSVSQPHRCFDSVLQRRRSNTVPALPYLSSTGVSGRECSLVLKKNKGRPRASATLGESQIKNFLMITL